MVFANPASAAHADPRPTGMPVGRYETYREAQRAVDYLSDQHFPVEHTTIVGKDLLRVERITGRLGWGRAAGLGTGSGAYLGGFFGLLLAIFGPEGTSFVAVVLAGILLGAVFGAIFGVIGYKLSGGRRDFTSSTVVIATSYEVLCDHRYANDARNHLAKLALTGEVRPVQHNEQPGPNPPDQPGAMPPREAGEDRAGQ